MQNKLQHQKPGFNGIELHYPHSSSQQYWSNKYFFMCQHVGYHIRCVGRVFKPGKRYLHALCYYYYYLYCFIKTKCHKQSNETAYFQLTAPPYKLSLRPALPLVSRQRSILVVSGGHVLCPVIGRKRPNYYYYYSFISKTRWHKRNKITKSTI